MERRKGNFSLNESTARPTKELDSPTPFPCSLPKLNWVKLTLRALALLYFEHPSLEKEEIILITLF